MIVRIEVTQADIDAGERQMCRACPVALAVARALKPKYIADVFYHRVEFFDGDGLSLPASLLPQHARFFIGAFDARLRFSPFAFDLDIPDEALKCAP